MNHSIACEVRPYPSANAVREGLAGSPCRTGQARSWATGADGVCASASAAPTARLAPALVPATAILAAKAGAEQWHSAMLPHAGTDSRIWQDVVQLGADLRALAEVRGSTSSARVAIVWDWNARWAMEQPSRPSGDLRFQDLVRRWYTPLWTAGVAVDFVRPGTPDLNRYQLVLAPSLYLVDDGGAAALAAFVERGGTLAVGFHSGVVDENCHVRLGGYPGAFRDVLGVHGDEPFPLLAGQSVGLTGQVPQGATADLWTERLRLTARRPSPPTRTVLPSLRPGGPPSRCARGRPGHHPPHVRQRHRLVRRHPPGPHHPGRRTGADPPGRGRAPGA